MKKTMLLISNMYPSKEYPHYGTFVKNFSDLSEHDFNIKLVVMTKCKSKLYKLLKYISFYIRIIFHILFSKNDIVYVHYISHVCLPLLLCKKIKKFTLYINVHGSDIVPETQLGCKLSRYVDRIMEKATRIIVPSSYFKELLISEHGVTEEKICIYPSGGIDPNIFYKISEDEKVLTKQELGLNPEFKYWGFASRIDVGKGWEIFMNAITEIKNENDDFFTSNRIIIIGSGKYEQKLDDMIKQYDMESYIIRKSMLNQKELAMFYQIFDWFVFPTYRKGESLGLVGLEAMACGVPVIATNYAGPATYIENEENGFLFEYKNSHDLCLKLMRASSISEKQYYDMKNKSLKTAEKYYPKNIEKIYKKIFSDR